MATGKLTTEWNGTQQLEINIATLHWRHNDHDGVSNHQPHGCFLNRLFTRRSKKTSNLCVTGLCVGNSPVNSPHKGPVTRKMFPIYDVIMILDDRESIMGASAERSSPKWVCVPEIMYGSKWFLWNTNSQGWTPFRTGAHNQFYFFHNVFFLW